MIISIIGSGNVASHLARLFLAHGHTIQQVYNRSHEPGYALAESLSATYISTLEELDTQHIDLILIAVSDDGIPDIIRKIPTKTKAIVLHTAGATPLSISSRFDKYGVIYPPQSMRKQVAINLTDVPFAVEGSSIHVQ